MSIVSTGCIVWLEQWQPVFAAVAVIALSYQCVLVRRRPARRRTPLVRSILWTSIAVNLLVLGTWMWWSISYA